MTLQQKLASTLLQAHPDDALPVLESLPEAEALSILAAAPASARVEAIRRMAPHRSALLVTGMERADAVGVVEGLGLDQAANLLRRVEANARDAVIGDLPPPVARHLRSLLRYPEGTAGALMDPNFLALPSDLTVQMANNLIRESPESVRYHLYVVDRDLRLVGVLSLRDLLLAKRKDLVSSIANPHVLSIRADAAVRAILDHPVWREAYSLPVVDEKRVYLGTIRYRTFRRLEAELARKEPESAEVTAQALGELFSAGILGAVGALASAASAPMARRPSDET